MKLITGIVALCVFRANAFSVNPKKLATTRSSSPVVLKSTADPPKEKTEFDMFPPGTFDEWVKIEGGGTVRTWKMPDYADRVQYSFKTNGRPMKGTVELWLGPIRKTHTLQMDHQDGSKTPYKATLKFKKEQQVLRIKTSKHLEYPLWASVSIPSVERAEELRENTETLWENIPPEQKLLIQGGSVSGGGGAIRSWTIPTNTPEVQILGWSRDVGKKSFKMKIEVLQGPNNKKQYFFLQCGGGSQPYHGVIQTPGEGWKVRIENQKFVEDGLYQFAVVGDGVVGDSNAKSQQMNPRPARKKEWWE